MPSDLPSKPRGSCWEVQYNNCAEPASISCLHAISAASALSSLNFVQFGQRLPHRRCCSHRWQPMHHHSRQCPCQTGPLERHLCSFGVVVIYGSSCLTRDSSSSVMLSSVAADASSCTYPSESASVIMMCWSVASWIPLASLPMKLG